MTEDELRRASLAEKRIRDFKIVNPDGRVQGGFGKLPLETQDHGERLSNIEKAIRDFRLIGGAGVNVSGGITHGGYTIEAKAQVSDSGAGGGGGGPTPTGACCIGASCSVLTAADCATMGGTYQGDGVSCGDVICGVCPAINLVCDQVCSSLTKCGFQRGSSPIHYYLSAERIWNLDVTCFNCGLSGHDGRNTSSGDLVYTVNPDTCEVSCSGSSDDYACCPDGDPGCTPFHDSTCGSWCPANPASCNDLCSFDWCFAASTSGVVYSCDDTGTNLTTEVSNLTVTAGGSGSGTSTTTYSDEYTTASLISNVEAAMPAYDGVFGDSSVASRELTSDEGSYSICNFKYKWTFAASPTANCTLTWNEHTEFEDMTTSDNPRSTAISIGDFETSVFECLAPSANGITTITDVVCTVD